MPKNQKIKDFLKRYNFKPNDLLGQNFLVNESALEKIVAAAELKSTDEVLEIGAGIGNLTLLLAQQAGFVLSVEKDQRYFPILKDVLGERLQAHRHTPKSAANVQLAFTDIVRFNFQEILKPEYKVVANIPYYISGKIVEMLLAAKNKPARIVLLMQKEVAERITAKAGALSILAISVQLYADAKLVGIVPKEDFYPQPKVDSAIIVLDLLAQPRLKVNEKDFFKIIKSAFAGKRKQIHNSLKNNLKIPSARLDAILSKGKIDPKLRPQDLTLQQWQFLSKNLAD